jgi:hypothetical protein
VQTQSGDKTGDAAAHHDNLHVFSLAFRVRVFGVRRTNSTWTVASSAGATGTAASPDAAVSLSGGIISR